MKNKHYVKLLIVLLLIVSALLWWRIEQQQKNYRTLINKTAQITEGYDQQFLAMVDRLEHELAERASFPYLGKKDPMTGKTRTVVPSPPREKEKSPRIARNQAHVAPAQGLPEVKAPEEVVIPDPVRLTAVIFDDIKRVHTAIMMVGERSYSVEVGDRVHGRRATEISVSSVTLEDQTNIYQYNINGQKSSRAK